YPNRVTYTSTKCMHFGEKYSLICHRYPTPRRRRGEQTSVCRRDHCSSTCVAGIVRSMSHKLGVLPSPLWGGAGGGGRSLLTRLVKQQRPPSPTLPHKGGGSAPGLPRVATHTSSLPSPASLSTLRSCGNAHIQISMTRIAPTPPISAEGTAPSAAATEPARNSPSEPDAPEHMELTAATRPSMS